MPNKDTGKTRSHISPARTEHDMEHTIKELRRKLDSFETPEQREQYIRGLIHGHNWFLETLERGLKLGLTDMNLDKFLKSEIQFQKIFWKSVRDKI